VKKLEIAVGSGNAMNGHRGASREQLKEASQKDQTAQRQNGNQVRDVG